mgnify:CR=1 FL=1
MANLTTVASVKSFLTITGTTQDALIAKLIARESTYVEQWTGRVFPFTNHTDELLNGSGTKLLTLPDSPVLSVSELKVLNTVVPQSADGIQAGFVFDETTLYLQSEGKFPQGYKNVTCSWVAGYQAEETDFVPTGNVPVLTPTEGGTASVVISVEDNTASLTMTEVGAAPVAGQFSFADGTFTFNSADFNHSVTMSYYYIPGAVEQAVIEMIGLDLQQRNTIGINSKSLATESISYEKKGMSDSAREMLQAYKMIGVY